MIQSLQNSDTVANVKGSSQATTPSELIPYIRRHFRLMLATDSADWNLSLYDLAWVLCSDYMNEEQRQHSLQVLKAVQNPDGTWGDCSYMPHSALIDTLAIIMALLRLEETIPNAERLSASVDALVAATREYPRHDTVAFELLMPLLLTWIEEHGFQFKLSGLSREFVERTLAKGKYKLSIVAQKIGLFNPKATLSYTAEFAALIPLSDLELDQLPNLILPNGAVGLSPAATAAAILVLRESNREVPEKLYSYLNNVFDAYNGRGFPNLYPYAHTQRLWNIVPWILSGNIFALMHDPEIRAMMLTMYTDIQFDEQGRVSWDTYNTDLPDLDDTSVTFALGAVLTNYGLNSFRRQPLNVFRHFQREDGSFFCYPHEMHPSPVGILHAVMAMELSSIALGYTFSMDPEVQFLMRDLIRNLAPKGADFDYLWHDKWHASWTYGAQRWLSIRQVRRAYPETVGPMIAEVVGRQIDGGWGQQAPSLEETAYVAAGLAAVLQDPDFLTSQGRLAIEESLRAAHDYMLRELSQETLHVPLIWISKNVYIPLHQAVSAVLDARYTLLLKSGARISNLA